MYRFFWRWCGCCCLSFIYGCGGSDGGWDGAIFKREVGIGRAFLRVVIEDLGPHEDLFYKIVLIWSLLDHQVLISSLSSWSGMAGKKWWGVYISVEVLHFIVRGVVVRFLTRWMIFFFKGSLHFLLGEACGPVCSILLMFCREPTVPQQRGCWWSFLVYTNYY